MGFSNFNYTTLLLIWPAGEFSFLIKDPTETTTTNETAETTERWWGEGDLNSRDDQVRGPSSDGAHQQLVLEAEADGHEDEVQQEHGEAEALVHLPVEAGDRHDDEQQHHEEYRYAAHHALRAHFHRLSVEDSVQQPRHRQSGIS